MFFLLDSQFVFNQRDGVTYKVAKGSGMGLTHSGATSECALLAGAELALVKALHTYGIDFYGRCKDDVLILFNDFELLRTFIGRLREGHPFKIKCESIDSKSVTFLEVRVTKTSGGYQCIPESKPSALSVPWLSRFSCHPPHIHNTWPVARAISRQSLCSNDRLKRIDLLEFVSRAGSHNLSYRATTTLNRMLTESAPHGISQPLCKREATQRKTDTFWIVLPFYKAMHMAGFSNTLQNLLNSVCIRRELSYLLGHTSVQVGWRNVVPCIGTMITSHAGRR